MVIRLGNMLGLLTIMLVILKCKGILDWDWIWIFSPILIGPIITLILVVLGVLILVMMLFSDLNSEK